MVTWEKSRNAFILDGTGPKMSANFLPFCDVCREPVLLGAIFALGLRKI